MAPIAARGPNQREVLGIFSGGAGEGSVESDLGLKYTGAVLISFSNSLSSILLVDFLDFLAGFSAALFCVLTSGVGKTG